MLKRRTKKATYGMEESTFKRVINESEGMKTMATFKQKKYRLEAIETAYNAVKGTADDMLTKWDRIDKEDGTHEWTQKTLSTDELDEEEQLRFKAYQDFMKELDKLA